MMGKMGRGGYPHPFIFISREWQRMMEKMGRGGTPPLYFYIKGMAKDDGKNRDGRGGYPHPPIIIFFVGTPTILLFNFFVGTSTILLFIFWVHVTFPSLVFQPLAGDPFFSIRNKATRPSHFILHSKQASKDVKQHLRVSVSFSFFFSSLVLH